MIRIYLIAKTIALPMLLLAISCAYSYIQKAFPPPPPLSVPSVTIAKMKEEKRFTIAH